MSCALLYTVGRFDCLMIWLGSKYASFSLLFPGGFEFAPGPWFGNAGACLIREIGRDIGLEDVTGRVGE